AAADDDVLFAVDDVDVVLAIPDGHVAGVQPVTAHHGASGFGFLEVTVHDVVTADDDLADGFHVAGHVAHFQIDHADFAARKRPTRHGHVPDAVLFVGVLNGALGPGGGRDGAGLGEAVARHDLAVKRRFHLDD